MPRDFNHDYRSKCIYHITIGKDPGAADFSEISGPLTALAVRRSAIGAVIEKHLRNLPSLCSLLRVLQYIIMPDHIHFLVHATDRLERHIGSYFGMLKVGIRQELTARGITEQPVFTEDFHDRILRPTHSLDAIYKYIRQNPYRLAVRLSTPEFFQRRNNIIFEGREWQAYGNIQILENPFKEQVVIHRADTEEIRNQKRNRWIHTAANGGVLVSPFISKGEKAIREEAESFGGKTILLSNKPFAEREKPALHDFNECAKGKLLILSPMGAMEASRSTFMYLNSIAAALCQR